MAKKMRPKKKRKYTRRKNVEEKITFQTQIKDITNEMKSSEAPQEPRRASENSYIFLDGCKLLIRNMSDVKLNDEHAKVYNRAQEVRHSLEFMESLQFNMSMEQRFRGLK